MISAILVFAWPLLVLPLDGAGWWEKGVGAFYIVSSAK